MLYCGGRDKIGHASQVFMGQTHRYFLEQSSRKVTKSTDKKNRVRMPVFKYGIVVYCKFSWLQSRFLSRMGGSYLF